MRTIYSFGYKMNGEDQFATTGPNAPRIIDCRGLNNPHNDPELRQKTGKDASVQDRVLRSPGSLELMGRAMEYLIEHPDGTVAFGCSYGKHRSVACAELVAAKFGVKAIHTGAARGK